MPEKVLPNTPLVCVKLFVTVRLPAPFNVPPVKLNEGVLRETALVSKPLVTLNALTVAAAPRFSVPPDTKTVPVKPPFKAPFRFAVPKPETVNAPSNEVWPVTVNEPPEISSEFEPLMVSAAMVSVPLECITAKLPLSSTESDAPGNTLPLQLVFNDQSKFVPLPLVKVIMFPLA